MTEENNTNETISISEEKARNGGWVDKEEWEESGKDPSEWVNHDVFNVRGELYDKISSQSSLITSQNKEVEKLKNVVEELTKHNKKIEEIQYKRALKELQKQKVKSLEDNDHEAVIEIDEQITELKDAKKESDKVVEEETKTSEQETMHPVIIDWLAKKENSWYHNNVMLRGAADAYAHELLNSTNPPSPEEMLRQVDAKIRENFPDKFGGKQKVTKTSRSSSTGDSTKSKKFSSSDLSEEQTKIGKTFVDLNAFENLDEYAQQLGDLGELPKQQAGA